MILALTNALPVRHVSAAIVAVLFVLLAHHESVVLAQAPATSLRDPMVAPKTAPDKPSVRVTISKETTWITAPLRDDGYPDYVRYLNEKLREGVTPENNAIVPLARTMGLLELEDHERTEYFRLLGIEPPPKDGDYFEPWWSYTSRTPEAEQPRVPPGDKRLQKDYFEQLVEEAASRPWTRKDIPHVAKWLEANEKHLETFLAASKLPRASSPWIIARDESFKHPLLINALVLDVDMVGDAAQALRCRAMLRANERNVQGAQEDLLAAQRLAVLLAQSPHLVCFVVAKKIECESESAAVLLCNQVPLSRSEISDFQKQWRFFPAFPTLARAVDTSERVQFLDACCYTARNGWHTLRDIAAFLADSSSDGEPAPRKEPDPQFAVGAAMLTWLVKWDEPLKLGNQWYDRLVRILLIENRKQQAAALDQFDADFNRLGQQARQVPTRTGISFFPRTVPSRFTSQNFVTLMLAAVPAAAQTALHLETHRSMFDIVMALFEYRADLKHYPDTLEKLVPEFIERIPVDYFGHRALVYRKTDAGFLLYSLGKNGRDDGGEGWSEHNTEADDVTIQVPATKQ
jgi:hypothetical protein